VGFVDKLLTVLVKMAPAPPFAEIVRTFGEDYSDAIAEAEASGWSRGGTWTKG
jgi:hypothetical protein